MIQLQYASDDGLNNLGGLYVRPESIIAVYRSPRNPKRAVISLSNGKEFTLIIGLTEMLDKLIEIKQC